MPTLPSTIALTTIAGQISASPHASNNTAIQTAVNGLIDALNDGAAGQVLTGVGSTLAFAYMGGVYRKSTAKTVASSTTETDLLNGEITVGANVLGTAGFLRLTAVGDWKQNSGGATDVPIFKLKLGSTTLLASAAISGTMVANSATRYPWRIVAEIANLGAANAQWADLFGKIQFANGGVNGETAFATGEGIASSVLSRSTGVTVGAEMMGGNSVAVDTTAGQALVLSVILPASSANCDIVLKSALIEVV